MLKRIFFSFFYKFQIYSTSIFQTKKLRKEEHITPIVNQQSPIQKEHNDKNRKVPNKSKLPHFIIGK